MAWWMRRSADSSATYESSHEPVDLHRQTSLPISWQISHLFWSQPRQRPASELPYPFGGPGIQRSQVTLTVHARDLSYHEHRELFRQVRQELNLVGQRVD